MHDGIQTVVIRVPRVRAIQRKHGNVARSRHGKAVKKGGSLSRKHKANQTGPVWRCNTTECDNTYVSKEWLVRHTKELNLGQKPEEKNHHCDNCASSFALKEHLKRFEEKILTSRTLPEALEKANMTRLRSQVKASNKTVSVSSNDINVDQVHKRGEDKGNKSA